MHELFFRDDPERTDIDDLKEAGIDPVLFETMLRFLYTEDFAPDFDTEVNAFEMLKLANKYGATYLKMLLESRILESGNLFNVDSAIDVALFADDHSCAQLLEAASDLLAKRIAKYMDDPNWEKVEKSAAIMSEIERATKSGNDNRKGLDSKSVAQLRNRAIELDLDADGTRGMLIAVVKSGLESISSSRRAKCADASSIALLTVANDKNVGHSHYNQ